MNTVSLINKIDIVKDIIDEFKSIDILGISETKIKNNSLYNVNIPAYHPPILNNSSSASGGVALYIKKQLNYVIRDDIKIYSNEVESVFAEIKGLEKNIVIGVIYRHPRSKLDQLNEFKQQMNSVMHKSVMRIKFRLYW